MKFYITTPIYYINDKPHIGSAYTTIAADVISRWHRQKGENTFFLTGSDEHGKKIQETAEQKKIAPEKFADEMTKNFKTAWSKLNISYDNFIRTTDKKHIEAIKKATQTLYNNGYIYKGYYEGLYCVGCEQYKQKSDLVNGCCPEHRVPPEIRREDAYLFKMSQFQQDLKKKIEADELKIRPRERKNEILSFLKNKLEDVAISRPKSEVYWGIELPFDKNHTLYVWIDAFLNYLTGLGWSGENKLEGRVKKYWPPNLQLMSKDILRVHATIWPSLLLALGFELPQEIFVHGYFTVNGQKMSKSLGNVIDPNELVKKLGERETTNQDKLIIYNKNFGSDVVRYFLMSSIPYASDGDFSLEKSIEKYNADLANGVGNLISRTTHMIEDYLNGKINFNTENELDDRINKFEKEFLDLMQEHKLFEALQNVFIFSKFLDKYLNDKKPWQLHEKKSDKSEIEKILTGSMKGIKVIMNSLKPFVPGTAELFEKSLNKNKIKGILLFPRLDKNLKIS